MQQIFQDVAAQGKDNVIAKLHKQLSKNPSSTVTVPILKPWEQRKEKEFEPRPKGEFEGLGYVGNIPTAYQGKVFMVEIPEGSK